MSPAAESPKVNRWLFTIALILIIVIALKTISFIVTLFMMSFILTLLTLPAASWLRRRGIPHFPATLIIAVLGILIVIGFIFFTMISFNSLVAGLPRYQSELDLRLHDINNLLNSYGITVSREGPPSLKLGDVMQYGYTGFMSFLETVEFLFFVGVTTFFLLLDAPRLAARLEARFGSDGENVRQMGLLTGYVADFIVVRTETNFIHGFLFGGFLGLIGVHGAILWGVLTFLLGYIPFVGLLIAAIPAIFFAWLQFGIPGALAVIVAVGILNLIVENPIYSFLAARKFEMPALVVILSVIFWGWLLGIVGMLFSIPFTLLMLLVFEMVNELRWINAVLGVSHLFEDHRNRKRAE